MNKIPQSRINLQKLKIEVIRKYFLIMSIVTVMNFFSVLLYSNQLVQFLVLALCFILSYKTTKIFNLFIKKESEILYKMIEGNKNE